VEGAVHIGQDAYPLKAGQNLAQDFQTLPDEIGLLDRETGPRSGPAYLIHLPDGRWLVAHIFAIYRGVDSIDRTEFLIDGSGWLRSMWYPGVEPDWCDPAVLAEEIEAIVNKPGKPQPASTCTLIKSHMGRTSPIYAGQAPTPD
jgi:hypothetical protein